MKNQHDLKRRARHASIAALAATSDRAAKNAGRTRAASRTRRLARFVREHLTTKKGRPR